MTDFFSTHRGTTRRVDRIGLALVAALQEDGRLRLEDLARRVELAPSSVHERQQRNDERG